MAIPGYNYNVETVPGIDRTNAGLGGQTPQQNITGYYVTQVKRLYKSHREHALLTDKTMRGGYGSVPAGTVMAKDQNSDFLVPYTPDTISESDYSRLFLLSNLTASGVSGEADVNLFESYKVTAGDTVVVTDTDGAYEELTVGSVDRTSSNVKATVNFTSAVSNDYTTDKMANVYLKAEDASSGKRSKAVNILDMEVDTGAGEAAKYGGGQAPVLLSHALLYKDAVEFMDATAISNLGNVVDEDPLYVVR